MFGDFPAKHIVYGSSTLCMCSILYMVQPYICVLVHTACTIFMVQPYVPYRLGFSPQPQKNILVSHSRINPAPWKYLIYTNPAQGFLPDRLQNTPKIPVFQSRTPKINRYFLCAQSPRRAKNDIFARWYKVCTVCVLVHTACTTHLHEVCVSVQV